MENIGNFIYLIPIGVIAIWVILFVFIPQKTVLSGQIKGLKETKFFNTENSWVSKYTTRIKCDSLGNCRVRIPDEFYEDLKTIRQAKKDVCLIVKKYRFLIEYKCICIAYT